MFTPSVHSSIVEIFSCDHDRMDNSDLLSSAIPTEPGAHGPGTRPEPLLSPCLLVSSHGVSPGRPDLNMLAEMLDERHRNRTKDVDAHMEEVKDKLQRLMQKNLEAEEVLRELRAASIRDDGGGGVRGSTSGGISPRAVSPAGGAPPAGGEALTKARERVQELEGANHALQHRCAPPPSTRPLSTPCRAPSSHGRYERIDREHQLLKHAAARHATRPMPRAAPMPRRTCHGCRRQAALRGERPPHFNCRQNHPLMPVGRYRVPDDKVDWKVVWDDYRPERCTSGAEPEPAFRTRAPRSERLARQVSSTFLLWAGTRAGR